MTDAAAPLSTLPEATRAAVRALLLAELTAAGRRARAAGCPPDVLTSVFDARSRSLEDGC
ncbi:hypothetical protein [Amycolatopsis tolypomycina]|uniref:Uncharacterized protein n=1 Tax=Amycolatopsis tolypomycina TaxID=208445 RepID=A0A1H4Z990_9PSEU|nr:hypothetical protein [Amycolatopsis tolypomycina]SED25981.1 hypothetical protein SAMN04489727_7127 [Amycolatopsis tolypomycina]